MRKGFSLKEAVGSLSVGTLLQRGFDKEVDIELADAPEFVQKVVEHLSVELSGPVCKIFALSIDGWFLISLGTFTYLVVDDFLYEKSGKSAWLHIKGGIKFIYQVVSDGTLELVALIKKKYRAIPRPIASKLQFAAMNATVIAIIINVIAMGSTASLLTLLAAA